MIVDCTVKGCLGLQNSVELFSKVAEPFFIVITNEQESLWPHTLTSLCVVSVLYFRYPNRYKMEFSVH